MCGSVCGESDNLRGDNSLLRLTGNIGDASDLKVKNSHLTKLFICMAVYVKQRELWHNERRSVSNTVKHTYGHKRKRWSKVHFALGALRTSLLNTSAPQSLLFHRHGGHLPYFNNHPAGESCIFKGLAILFLVVRQCNVTADNWQHCSFWELLKH